MFMALLLFKLCIRTVSALAIWVRSSGWPSFQSCSAASTAFHHLIRSLFSLLSF